MENTITTIEKELLQNKHFPPQEVLSEANVITERFSQAKRAMLIGNYLKNKVKIVFEDMEGKKRIETTVWGLTDTSLLLKGDITLPLHRVHEIII